MWFIISLGRSEYDFDLRLSSFLRPYNNHRNVETTATTETIASLHNPNVDHCVENQVSIKVGPTSIVQAAKLRRIVDIQESWEESVMSTHRYIRKVVEDVGNIKNFLKNEKLDRVIAIIKSCTPNALDDLTVTLKDLSGTLSGTIYYKVLAEGGYRNDISLGAALIVHNVLVFTPKP
nr:hypothetical protein [Tanacetum cinerariifolium]